MNSRDTGAARLTGPCMDGPRFSNARHTGVAPRYPRLEGALGPPPQDVLLNFLPGSRGSCSGPTLHLYSLLYLGDSKLACRFPVCVSPGKAPCIQSLFMLLKCRLVQSRFLHLAMIP